jgi:hypothetical protein
MRVEADRVINYSSAPRFTTEADAVIACGWAVELADATAHLLPEFGNRFRLDRAEDIPAVELAKELGPPQEPAVRPLADE